ncbi:hypothetical protein [Pedobacter changchengzhani]|nr:hypothetical protein [Pedobacter changchengzhani]
MSQINLYYPLWKRYLPVFAIQLKKALSEEQEINFTKSDFHNLGNRNKSDYSFSLEIENGKVKNNISGSAVARDLYDLLISDAKTKELLQGNHFKFSLGKAYILKIVSLKANNV